MTPCYDAPDQVIPAFLAAFNAGDTVALDQLYEPDGVLVPRPGCPTTGPGRAAANGWLFGLGLPMQAQVRHSYVAGDIALLVVDWRVQGTGPDGAALDLSGTATDVVRRGSDGTWRYVIDNPQGSA